MIHQHFDLNEKGRDFVVGDLHGHFQTFWDDMNALNFDRQIDRMFSVGDLIDRGPDSQGCAQLIDRDWFHPVRGNHEQMFLMALGEAPERHLMGGEMHWADRMTPLERHELGMKFISMPFVITVGKAALITHASFNHGSIDHFNALKDHEQNNALIEMIWDRDQIMEGIPHIVEGVDVAYHGHTPVKDPVDLGNHRFIDTGCFYTGLLTIEEIK